jgi:hypothetical protein
MAYSEYENESYPRSEQIGGFALKLFMSLPFSLIYFHRGCTRVAN